jgi:hypothetical protein
MVVPDSWVGVAVMVVLVIPGVVHAGVRTWLRGYRWSDQSTGTRLLEAVVVSVLLDAVYLALIGARLAPWIADPQRMLREHPAAAGIGVLLTAVVVPAALAVGMHAEVRFDRPAHPRIPPWVPIPHRKTAYESTPTAWDRAAPGRGDTWVRVLLPSGERVGGWMSGDSHVSTFPQQRDMYIQEQFEINADGTFGNRVPGTAGIWLAVTDECIVEWLERGPEGGDDD